MTTRRVICRNPSNSGRLRAETLGVGGEWAAFCHSGLILAMLLILPLLSKESVPPATFSSGSQMTVGYSCLTMREHARQIRLHTRLAMAPMLFGRPGMGRAWAGHGPGMGRAGAGAGQDMSNDVSPKFWQ